MVGMRSAVAAVFLGAALCACAPTLLPSVAGPVASDPGLPDIPVPPAAVIDGVAGMPVSFCWGGACVDGFAGPDMARGAEPVRGPGTVVPPAGAHVESVQSIDFAVPNEQRPVPFQGVRFGHIAEGADLLLIGVRWPSGEDVLYAWPIAR
jgi:hypothetical protein